MITNTTAVHTAGDSFYLSIATLTQGTQTQQQPQVKCGKASPEVFEIEADDESAFLSKFWRTEVHGTYVTRTVILMLGL